MALTILIVDDEENLRITLSRILTKEEFDVTSASNGEEALQFLQAGAYDLAVIDLLMPGMDGMTLLGEIRSLYPEMPVLILTAHAALDSAIEAVRQGARDYLVKPADPPLIIARVNEILTEQKQPQRQREILNKIQNLVSEFQQLSGKPEDMPTSLPRPRPRPAPARVRPPRPLPFPPARSIHTGPARPAPDDGRQLHPPHPLQF
ncbi:MAG: response regulator [Anaerolineales bacterium]|nr:MAG: response regulator [Anaerolineales bacterium]